MSPLLVLQWSMKLPWLFFLLVLFLSLDWLLDPHLSRSEPCSYDSSSQLSCHSPAHNNRAEVGHILSMVWPSDCRAGVLLGALQQNFLVARHRHRFPSSLFPLSPHTPPPQFH